MTIQWTWKEALRFALAKGFYSKDHLHVSYDISQSEKIASWYLRPLEAVLHWISSHIRKPWIIVALTLLVALSAVLVFYNVPVLLALGRIFPSQLVRFVLFFYVETNLLSMGCRAFSRFNNAALVDLWKKN